MTMRSASAGVLLTLLLAPPMAGLAVPAGAQQTPPSTDQARASAQEATAGQAAGEKPLTQAQLVTLVNQKTPVADIVAQIKQRGLGFELTPDFEASLSKAESGAEILAAMKEPATLAVHVNVSGASVVVDGQEARTADADGRLTVSGLAPGNHLLRAEAERHLTERNQVFLKPGETRSVEITLAGSITAEPGPLGISVNVRAGTPEDALISNLDAIQDPAERMVKIKAMVQEYADSPLSLLGYRMLQETALAQKDYDQAIAAGNEVFQRDPNNFNAHVRQARALLGKQQFEDAFSQAEAARQLVEKLAAGGTAGAQETDQHKQAGETQLKSLAYDFYADAARVTDAARKAALLERFLQVFPDSDYQTTAQVGLAYAYQAQNNTAKTVEWADRALDTDPNQGAALVLVADTLSSQQQPSAGELKQARTAAAHLLDLLQNQPDKVRPGGYSDEQWQPLARLWEGTAHSALGQVDLHEEKNAEAISAFQAAAPLLKEQALLYARNLFRLGFVYAKVGDLTKARDTLTQLIGMNTAYSGPAQPILDKVNAALSRRPH